METPYERNLSKDYLISEMIGKGSFGEVNKAIHRVTRQCVALKKIPNATQNLATHLREVKMMKKCKDGPNIVQIYGSEIVGNDLWISMELCESGSLFDIMRMTQTPFTEFQIARICKSTLRAIAWMAEHNIAHRDIKPHNLMVKQSGKIRLGDFGISREMDSNGQATDMIGSLLYLAPEVARQQPYTTKIDVWSLGVTCIELAQGFAPRHRLNSDELLRELYYGTQPPFFDRAAQFSSCFLDFVKSCLMLEPSIRPAAADLLNHPFLQKSEGLKLGNVAEEVSSLVSLNGSYASALERSIISKSRSTTSTTLSSSIASNTSSTSAASQSRNDGTDCSRKHDTHNFETSSSTTAGTIDSQAGSTASSINISPVIPKRIITPKAAPKFPLPLLRLTKNAKKSDIFTLGVSKALASPRDFQQQIQNLQE